MRGVGFQVHFMKQFLLLFCLSSISQFSLAQTVFCPEGARWMYDNSTTNMHPPIQSTFIYIGDTVLNGYSNSRILKQEVRGLYSWGGTYYSERLSYFRQSGDSIFEYVDDNFEFVFDFGVEIGDTRIVHFDADLCFHLDTMLIQNIDTIEYQGIELRRFHYKLLVEDQRADIEGPGLSGVIESQYVERLGFMVDHPVANTYRCEGDLISEYEPRKFTCYTDNELAVNFPDTCNLFLSVKSDAQKNNAEIVFLNQSLQIQNATNSTLRVFDILGKELLQTPIYSDNQTVGIEHLPNGILIVSVETEKGRVTKKVVKTALP